MNANVVSTLIVPCGKCKLLYPATELIEDYWRDAVCMNCYIKQSDGK